MVATPFIPYGVVKFGTACGIMVTASHNPKEDNGYKVYWSNGAQIIPPHDKGIQLAIEQNLQPWPGAWDWEAVRANHLCKDPLPDVMQSYFEMLQNEVIYRSVNYMSQLLIKMIII